MARISPFEWFRRNQTAAFAFLAVMAMTSFIVLPIVMQIMSDRSGGGDGRPLVAKCSRYGNVTVQLLERLRNQHDTLGRFYAVLYNNLGGANNQLGQTAPLGELQEMVQAFGQVRSDEDLVNDWLMTQHGYSLGMSASEESIREHLLSLTAGAKNVTAGFQKTLADIGLPRKRFDAVIADFLVLTQVRSLLFHNLWTPTPSTKWNAFERLQRKIAVEAAAVPVSRYVGEVAEPTRDELAKFFEANRRNTFNPELAESGFAIPKRLSFGYVIAEPTDEMIAAVDAAAVEKYYDENKATLFRRPPKLRETPEPPLTTPGSELILPSLTPSATEPDSAPEVAPDATHEEPATVVPTPVEPTPEPAETPAPKEPAEEPATVAYRPVVFTQTDAEPADATPAPSTDSAEPVDNTPIDLNILFRPLSEVESQIRHTLALEALEKKLQVIEDTMRNYLLDYTQRGDAAVRPDIAKLAADNGFTYIATPAAVSIFEVEEKCPTAFADSAIWQRVAQFYQRPPVNFEPHRINSADGVVVLWVTESFQIRYPEFDEVVETVRQRWKEVEARKLARAEAERLAQIAKQNATTLADAFASQNPQPEVAATELFSWKTYGDPYLALQMAQWGMPPRLSEVHERGADGKPVEKNRVIKNVGDAWMGAAYALGVDGVGVAFNEPQTIAYVIRLVETTPPVDELVPKFRSGAPWDFDTSLYRQQTFQTFERFLAHIQQTSGFEWVMPESSRRLRYGE
ncbi:MAG: hypothetical protein ACRC46_09760 [Thermoguttaceae bacterium]